MVLAFAFATGGTYPLLRKEDAKRALDCLYAGKDFRFHDIVLSRKDTSLVIVETPMLPDEAKEIAQDFIRATLSPLPHGFPQKNVS